MKKLFTYLLAIVFPLYLMGAGLWSAEKARKCEYAGVQIAVVDSARAQYLTSAEILEQVRGCLPADAGIALSKVDTDSLEAMLRRNHLIAEVECYKTPSGLLRIDVWQCVPVLRVFGNNGSYFIDEHGRIISGSLPVAVRVPVATGNISSEFACGELYPFALFLQKSAFWRAQIEQIYVGSEQDIVLIPRVGDHRIVMGGMDDYREKLNNLRCFYDQALSQCGWNKYKTINLKYKNQVVATRK